jgi:hypothetical protein
VVVGLIFLFLFLFCFVYSTNRGDFSCLVHDCHKANKQTMTHVGGGSEYCHGLDLPVVRGD